jgi:hypothetical protein
VAVRDFFIQEEIMLKRNVRTFSVFVIFLALMSISCGVSGLPFMATETPTPTSTFTPTATFTATPTLTPTQTPTATPKPDAVTETLADGSTRFTDYVGGYSFILPKGWLVINFVTDDPEQALEDAKVANPDKAALLDGLRTALIQKARMGAADFIPDHYIPASAPLMFNILDGSTQAMTLQEIVDANAQMLPQLLKATVKASDIMQNPSGVSYGVIDVVLDLSANGSSVSVFEKLVIFKTDDYTIYLTMAALDELKEGGYQGVDALIESIELLP